MQNSTNRREFLKNGTLAAGAVAGGLSLARSAHAAGSDVLRVGLVGCGGRGTGAAVNALDADPNTKLVAMADAFADRIQGALSHLRQKFAARVTVDKDHTFVGFDAYEKLIASGVDVVILTTPPHFRPQQLKACVDAGKHVFCEKPVSVDGPGTRSVLATCEEAAKKNLSIVSGLCWRYDNGVCETMKRVLDGAIGEILTIQETYNTDTLWLRPRRPEWTEMEYQMRNWYYFTWLSGDHNVEQHVHSLDKAAWAMHDEPPLKAWGLGGRQVRVDPAYGDIFDHHAVCYEYPKGVRVYSYCRQMAGCSRDVSDIFVGTKGRADILANRIESLSGKKQWRYEGPKPSMYDVEHQALFAAIRAGKPINNGLYMSRSSMLAILGRMVTHSGQTIAWEQAINSPIRLAPERYGFDATPPTLRGKDGKYPVAVPGVTKVV
jgi:myo-inositol 2-dehydrogenase / D-chiro-inositol 1-dehydrogenase